MEKQIIDGQWFKPVIENYVMTCCNPDCGWRHRIDFKITVAGAAISDPSKTSHAIGPWDDLEIRVSRIK